MPGRAVVVGAGVFGVTAALSLRRRGWEVVLVDPGPVPHPNAASTDLSKMVRMEYGADRFYTELVLEALGGWDAWNARWGEALYHDTGVLFLTRDPPGPESYESQSRAVLESLGQPVTPMTAELRAASFPAWARGEGGLLSRRGGWAESGRVVARLCADARAAGVDVREGTDVIALRGAARVTGVVTSGGVVEADEVIVAAGAWSPRLVPELSQIVAPVGQPILLFRPPDPDAWRPPRFLPWAADISTRGWYGFPASAEGLVKVANHGEGVPADPAGPREVGPEWEPRFRAFLAEWLPGLADAPLIESRLCLYCDSFDGDLLVDRPPGRRGLVVSTGGSGHAFKMAPLLGDIAADVVEARDGPWRARFAWRTRGRRRFEAARSGDPGGT